MSNDLEIEKDPARFDDDPHLFSMYLARVSQTFDTFDYVSFMNWVNDKHPQTINDVGAVPRDLFDITIDDYRQFCQQVEDAHDEAAEEAELEAWMYDE